eukprot:350324-Chlamydomonas_euryale.AAC.3
MGGRESVAMSWQRAGEQESVARPTVTHRERHQGASWLGTRHNDDLPSGKPSASTHIVWLDLARIVLNETPFRAPRDALKELEEHPQALCDTLKAL